MSLYGIGDLAELDFAIEDPTTDSPVDPASASLVVTAPDGSTPSNLTLADMVRLDVGQYRASVPLSLRGVYSWRWASTGAGQSAATGQLSVGMSIVTLDEAKLELNYRSIDVSDDAELPGFILAATEVVEEACGPVLQRPAVDVIPTPPFGTYGSPAYCLDEYPVVSVDTVTLNSATPTVLDPSKYALGKGGKLTRIDGYAWGVPPATISYTVGRPSIPYTIRLATLELIAHWWQGSQQAKAGGGSIVGTYDDVDTTPTFVNRGMPYHVTNMLKPFRRAPASA